MDRLQEWVESDSNIADIPSRDGSNGHKEEVPFRALALSHVPLHRLAEDAWEDPISIFRQFAVEHDKDL